MKVQPGEAFETWEAFDIRLTSGVRRHEDARILLRGPSGFTSEDLSWMDATVLHAQKLPSPDNGRPRTDDKQVVAANPRPCWEQMKQTWDVAMIT